MTGPLPPGAVIGVLGGGQLGRMLALAAARLGFDVHVFADAPDCPAARVAARATTGSFEDAPAVAAFAEACDVVTYEFENVPVAAAEAAARASPLRPGARALAMSQDRWLEKGFARDCGAATVACAPVDTVADLAPAIAETGLPALLKTRRLGYDGKGQAWIRAADEATAAFDAIGARPAILEADARFAREISLILARGTDGATAAFDVAENVHAGGVLRTSRAPAGDHEALAAAARPIVEALAEALDHVGVITAEFFVADDGALTFNEFAPRVHNS
ncbi:MAG: ATP-grasp domain-containing protein, partial [Caulobacterales bacterium]|nr:ATP-grasp domain-containing protein [Caulobacterales bacterium]